jgi:hypothetical protein
MSARDAVGPLQTELYQNWAVFGKSLESERAGSPHDDPSRILVDSNSEPNAAISF